MGALLNQRVLLLTPRPLHQELTLSSDPSPSGINFAASENKQKWSHSEAQESLRRKEGEEEGRGGGAEAMLRRLALATAARGGEVKVICDKAPASQKDVISSACSGSVLLTDNKGNPTAIYLSNADGVKGLHLASWLAP